VWRLFFNSNWLQLLKTKFIWQIPNAGETMSFLPHPFPWEWSVYTTNQKMLSFWEMVRANGIVLPSGKHTKSY